MPAKNPRLTITLEPAVHAQLRRISQLTGNSQASLISDLLTGTGPVFQRLINVLEAANDAKAALRGQLAKDLHLAQAKIEESIGGGLAAAGLEHVEATLPLPFVENTIHRRARRKSSTAPAGVAPERIATPPSNRGVRSTAKTPKKSTATRG